jgi:ADP-ribose pyrophosphatase YjhB (NUDIX family)
MVEILTSQNSNRMHRSKLIATLEGYLVRYPQESDMVERFIAFVKQQPRCFHRDCLPGHVTGSAWIVNQARDAVLLTHHKKLDRWLQPGGHSDGDPDPLAVAWKEGTEESGLELEALSRAAFDVDIHDIPARGDEPGHQHFDVRYAFLARSDAYRVSAESHDLVWAPLQKLHRFTRDTSVLRMRKKCDLDHSLYGSLVIPR